MKWIIDNNKPIHSQLVDQLKARIISGEIKAGEKLDAVRVMAQEAEVNPNTMQKALVELERQELIYSKRTTGRFVTDNEEKIKSMRADVANICINELKESLIKIGYSKEQIMELVKHNLEEN